MKALASDAGLSLSVRWAIARAMAEQTLARPFGGSRDFDPNQPRDESGKWTDGGGGDGGSADGSGQGKPGSADKPDAAGAIDSAKVQAKAKANVAISAARATVRGVKPLDGSVGHPNLVATRLITSKKLAQPDKYNRPDVAAMKLNQKSFTYNMELFKHADFYPNFRPKELAGGPDQIARAVIDHMKANLKFLYENAPTKDVTKVWYDGANLLTAERAARYGFNDASVVAVYAALSPTCDWDKNVHLGDQLLNIYATKQGHAWDTKMEATANRIWGSPKNKLLADLVRGKKLSDLKAPIVVETAKGPRTISSAVQQAVWIRTYDEAHNAQHYRVVRPDGTLGELAKNKDGSLAGFGWQSVSNTANAIRALEADGDLQLISAALPRDAHKVRSFFNNILDPNSANEDVTIDTHAVGAALLRPLGGSHPAPTQNFGNTIDKADQPEGWKGTSDSVVTGVHGLYPIYADAVREAAQELGISPRQLQSITWETKRALFPDTLKAEQAQAIEQVWRDYHNDPTIALADVQKQVVGIAGGIRKDWQNERARRSDRDDGGAGHRGHARELHRHELGRATAALDSRAGGAAAERAAGLVAVRAGQDDQRAEAARSITLRAYDDIKFPALEEVIARDAFDITAGKDGFELIVTARIPPGIEKIENDQRRTQEYYDPKFAKLETLGSGAEWECEIARPKEGFATSITPLPDQDAIYRGMSYEEFQHFQRIGRIESSEGLTYWTTDTRTAEAYANGFAPWSMIPTFEKPAFVVATTMPKETRVISGTGENEVGVARPITRDEIIGVWQGDVYSHRSGSVSLRREGDEGDVYVEGSRVSPGSSVVWSRKNPAKALLLYRDFDPNQPRDEEGKWTEVGGDGGGGTGSEADAKPEPAKLDPAVVSVGGDEWNRATAARLEREYQAARPAVDKLAQEAPGHQGIVGTTSDAEGADIPFTPEEWDQLSDAGQSDAGSQYVEQNKESYYESEVENWHNSGDAMNDAKAIVMHEFNKGEETDWMAEAIDEYRGETDVRIPYTTEQLIDAISLSDKGVEFDDAALQRPSNLPPPEQQTFPGIEPAKPEAQLTAAMRAGLNDAIRVAFDTEAEERVDKIEPPAYLTETAEEFLEESWAQLDSDEKFEWTKQHTEIIAGESTGGTLGELTEAITVAALPEQYDPLNKTTGRDYQLTQQLARYLSLSRASYLLKERKLASPSEEKLARYDKKLWTSWKASSTSADGKLLQLAAADELGGRLNTSTAKTTGRIDREEIESYANSSYAAMGGYAGIKAYMRAKWETTQYLLDKAGVTEIALYRGIALAPEVYQKLFATIMRKHWAAHEKVGIFNHMPTLDVKRNGAASTTTDRTVANGWGASTHRVVLRASVPRTAAISVPAYGVNVLSEHEVVVAGTAWKGWDVWAGAAPDLEQVPLRKAA